MIDIGKYNTLRVLRETSAGFFLDAGDKQSILLPGRYIPENAKLGDLLTVFVYLDSEDRLVATTETPRATVGEFAWLKVVSVNQRVGAFLDWGLAKDLLLPFREQTGPLHTGDGVLVYVYLDPTSNRIVATTRLSRHLSPQPPPYTEGQPVNLLIGSRTPRGFNAIIENAHRGLLYHTDIVAPLESGQKIKGYVRRIRPDGKIDLSVNASGYKLVAPLTEQILAALKTGGGRIAFDDSTSPQLIRDKFGVSKNAFKLALGALYKKRQIRFLNPGIELVN
jgi:predicted RNA-binding protein (virulence factor B family)